MRPLLLLSCLAGLIAWEAGPTNAQQRPTRGEVWDLKLGAAAGTLPDEFTDYACGTNGGPPSVPLRRLERFQALPAGAGWTARGLFPLRRRAGILGQGQQFRDRDPEIFRHQDFRFPGRAVGALRRQRYARRHPHRQRSARYLARPRGGTTSCATSSPHATAARAGTASTCRPRTARRRSSAPSSSSAAARRSKVAPCAEMQTNFFRKKGQSRDRRPHRAHDRGPVRKPRAF